MRFDAPYVIESNHPTTAIIWLHGLGADGYDFAPLVPELDLSYSARFIFPHASVMPVTLNGGMPCRSWFDIRSLSRFEDEDIAGMNQAETYVQSLIQTQLDQGIPSERIILMGFSQGGAMALYAGLRYHKPLGGIVGLSTLLAGSVELELSRSPANQATPLFLAHGTYDTVLPFAFAEHSRQWLKDRRYQVEWHEYAMAHQVQTEEIRDLSRFLNVNRPSATIQIR